MLQATDVFMLFLKKGNPKYLGIANLLIKLLVLFLFLIKKTPEVGEISLCLCAVVQAH